MAKRGQCNVCHGLLPGDLRGRYCSDACKMRAYRARKKAAGRIVKARGAKRVVKRLTRRVVSNGRRLA